MRRAMAATARSTPLWLDLAGWWVAVGRDYLRSEGKAGRAAMAKSARMAAGGYRRGAKVAVVESATLGIPGSASAAAGSRAAEARR